MAGDYKLCPNCNNALDLSVSKCPYCGQQLFWLDLSWWNGWFVKIIKNIKQSDDKTQTSGCAKIIICIIVIQMLWAVLSLIFQILSSL